MKLSKNEGKSPEQLYKEGKISEKQWKNYNAEVYYRAVIGATANVINNSAAPIVNSLYAGMNENSRKTYSEWETNNRAGETGNKGYGSNQKNRETTVNKTENNNSNNNSNENLEDYNSRVSGSKNNQYNQPKNPYYQKVRNENTVIDGIEYGGHALDRMQDRGITPSAVKEAITYGIVIEARNGRKMYIDYKNNITVITENGKVVTVRYGGK